MSEVVKTLLECTTGGSNKFYEVRVIYRQSTSQYDVVARWGKRTGLWRTAGGSTQVKNTTTFVESAMQEHDRLVRSKIDKRYTIVDTKKKKETKPAAPAKKKEKELEDESLKRFGMLEF